MIALSVKQPWANMIAAGEKTIETRRWSTSYRGDLLIVSSLKPRIAPAGCAVAIVRLVDCQPMTVDHVEAAQCELYDGAYAWFLDTVRPIRPVRVTGQLGLYEVQLAPRSVQLLCT